MRRFKLMGVAVVAVLALTAVSAAAASAHTFKTASSPTFLNGEQVTKNVFTVEGGTVKCTGAVFTSGEITGTSLSSVTVHPSYSGCTAFGQEAEVNTGTSTNGCNYELTAEGKVSIKCVGTATGIVVKAKTAGCTVTVKGNSTENQNLGTVSYANKTDGSFTDVEVTAAVTGIKYTSSGGICGASGTAGGYTGSVLEKGYKNTTFTAANQHSVSWE
jgi:hypothetical protein